MAQMDPIDLQPFLEALNEIGEFFSDELSELRQRSYWRVMENKCSLAEWRDACLQAMARETFHKVPLPAQLMDYVREYRREQRRRLEEEEQRQFQVAYNLREAERLALEASPEWRAEQQRLAEECWAHEHAEQWSCDDEDENHGTLLETFDYQPQGDPAEAKRKAREQLAQIMAEDSRSTEEH